MNLEERKEYKDWLKEHYNKNQEFIDKALFATASASIALLIKFSDSLGFENKYAVFFYLLSLLSFTLVIITQIVACVVAKDGCDLGFDNSKINESLAKFKIADRIDFGSICVFIIALTATFVTVIIKILF